MAIDPAAPRSRRAILAGALAGTGALIAHSLGRATPVAAADDDPILLGQGSTATENAATLPTIVNSTASPGLAAVTPGATARTALEGTSGSGIGVLGISNGPVEPATGRSTGVVGLSGGGGGLDPEINIDETGVYGFSDESFASAGIWGDTIQGIGVVGTGDWGVYGFGSTGVLGGVPAVATGVYGFAGDDGEITPPTPSAGVVGRAGSGAKYGIVAAAAASDQFALYASGRLRLTSCGGRTTIASTATSKKVILAGITASSFVVATLQTSISGCYVRAVVATTGSFTIYLSKAPGKTAAIGYIVAN